MKNILLSFLLLASLVGNGQSNMLEGTIWITDPVWKKSDNDSVVYSVSFLKNKAVIKIKHKKLARVEIIDTLSYPFQNKDFKNLKPNESVAYMGAITDSGFTLSHFSHLQGDSVLRIQGLFHLKVENTLNGTVWESKSGYMLSFTSSAMYMRYRNNKEPMRFNYKLSGDNVTLDISNKLKILPGRQTLEFEEPGHRIVIYTKVTK